MGPMSASELTPSQQHSLITLARESIHYGFSAHRPLEPALALLPSALSRVAASFVTLHKAGDLRGCIGTLEAYQPLATDVAAHAYAAAFDDPRFGAVTAGEFDELQLSVSILSAAQELRFENEEGLLRLLRPGLDGLILQEQDHRATFLPSVWASLPEPEHFLGQLKRKADLPEDYWSHTLRVWRYTTQILEQEPGA